MPQGDESIQRLQRLVRAEPDNDRAVIELIKQRVRIHGDDAFLDLLSSANLWNKIPHEFQDQAINRAAKKLAPAYKLQVTRDFQCQALGHRLAVFVHELTRIELLLVPGGTYLLGTAAEDLPNEFEFCKTYYTNYDFDWIAHEAPPREVTLDPFLIGRFPVLEDQWHSNPMVPEESREFSPDYPQVDVSYLTCQNWLQDTGDGMRLPNEAEWEYACRAGAKTRFFWGDKMDPAYCWFDENSDDRLHPVTEHLEHCNAFGLVDILGNVWEICSDARPKLSINEEQSSRRALRGGCYYESGEGLRCNFSPSEHEDLSNNNQGFRVVVDLPRRTQIEI